MVCIFTYTWLICLVNVGKFSDTESYGMIYATLNDRWCCDGRSCFKPSKIRNHGTEMGSMHGQLCLQQIILKRDINSHPWKFTCPLKKVVETGNVQPWNGKVTSLKMNMEPKNERLEDVAFLFKEAISGSMSIFHGVPMSRWGLA